MRSINWLLAGCVLGIGIETAPAQQATPEQINKALELLRSMPPLTNAAAGTVTNVTVPVGQLKAPASPAPAAAVTDPKALREAAQKAEAAARQQANRETKRLRDDKQPANANSLAEEQELRVKTEAERQKEISRIEAEVEKVRQARAQSTNATGLSPNLEKQARELLNQVMENTKDAKLPTTLVPTITTGTTPKSTKAEAGLPAITVAPAPAAPVTPAAPAASQPAKPATVAVTPPVATPAAAQGTLTPEQERKARELLDRALSQTPAQPAVVKTAVPTAPAPVVTATPPAAPAPTPAPVVTATPAVTPAPVVTAAPAVKTVPPSGLTSEQERKAIELLEKKLRQETGNREVVQSPASPTATPPAAITSPAVATPPAAVPAPTPAKVEYKTKEEIKAESKRLEKEQREAELKIKAEAKKKLEVDEAARRTLDRMEAESNAKAKEQAGKRLAEGDKTSKEAKVKAEPASVSAPVSKAAAKSAAVKTKPQRLAELLESYMKDQLTPEQYHTQRAKLLAEP